MAGLAPSEYDSAPMHWLLAYTKPRQEALAEQHLRRQRFEVPLKLIEGLRNAAEEPQAARPLFKQGQKVRIVTGAFATLEAVFDLAEGEERATVLLDLLGRQSRVRVPVGELIIVTRLSLSSQMA